MSFLSLHSLSIAYGGESLLDNVSLDIQKGQRICLLGRNGVGKSTLLRIIAGEERPDSGEMITAPDLTIAYLPQNVPSDRDGCVFDIVASGAGEPGSKLALWHHLAGSGEADAAVLQELQQYLDIHDGWSIQTRVEQTLEQMKLNANSDFATLSGGMRRRVFLARALVGNPDLLLLDEPTNHLDIGSITWLESYILGSKCTVLFITHDRKFLKRLATRIIELDRGQLADWSCDYETFLQRKQALLDAQEREWERFDKKLAQEETWIRRGIKARRTRNEGRVRALIKMREQRQKRRERSGEVSMAISEAGRSGNLVLEAKNVQFSYNGSILLDNVNVRCSRGDRIGVIGPNGCGKTTLLTILLGKLEPQQGSVRLGTNLNISYFDQLRGTLDPEKTVWENVAPGGGDTVFINDKPKHIVSYLRDFLFTTDRIKSPVKQLSGGERNRLMLARLFSQPANVLVFDEPTNDLDAETLELLEELLSEFGGTVLVVSHDREFLNNVVTSILAFEGGATPKEYVGGYDDWERQKSRQSATESQKTKPKKAPSAPVAQNDQLKKLSYNEKRELESIPAQIEKLEKEYEQLNLQMADPAYYGKPGFVASAKNRIETIEHTLQTIFQRWELLENRPQ
jgi:ABC transport system ATP-binding/permease protein